MALTACMVLRLLHLHVTAVAAAAAAVLAMIAGDCGLTADASSADATPKH
jgi:hypothetical protein